MKEKKDENHGEKSREKKEIMSIFKCSGSNKSRRLEAKYVNLTDPSPLIYFISSLFHPIAAAEGKESSRGMNERLKSLIFMKQGELGRS